jgi:hypothetical protein
VLKDGSSTSQSGNSQEKIGPSSESSANCKVNPDTEKGPKKVAVEQNRVPEAKVENRTEAGTSLRQPPNQIVSQIEPSSFIRCRTEGCIED